MVKNEITKNNKNWEKFENVEAETLYPVPGDIISLGTHYGIYIGQGQIIHYPRHYTAIRKDFLIKLGQNGHIAFSINRETAESETRPLLAEEIMERAMSMLGKTKKKLYGINDSKDFVNWCRYGVTSPDVQDATFETPKHLGELFFCLGRCWSAADDRHVSSLGLSDIDARAILAEEQVKQNQDAEFTLLEELFGGPKNIDEMIEKTNLICLKEPNEDRSYTVSCFLVDKENGSFRRVLMVWETQKIEEDLLETFGNRNMCIIE